VKKLIIYFLLFVSTLYIKAQCSDNFTPNGFIDFEDTNGYLHTLDDYLLSGKIVVLEFYLQTCGSCMASAPCLENLYQNYGWNNGDVIVLSFDISSGNPTNEDAIQFALDYGMPNVPNFSQKGGEQNTVGFWSQFNSECDGNGGMAQSYILSGTFCCGDPDALNYETGCAIYNSVACIYNENETAPIQGVSYAHQGGSINCSEMTNHIDNLLIEMMDIEDQSYNEEKNIINTINILGQKVNNTTNTLFFNIYNDGSIKKKFIFK